MNAPWAQPWSGVVVAALVAATVLPGLRRWYVGRGWTDAPGHRKIHAEPIPLAGGAALLAGWCAGWGWLVFSRGGGGWDAGSPGSGSAFVDLAAVLGLFLLGWWDDIVELKPLMKLLGQAALAAMVVAAGIRLPVAREWPVVQAAVSGFFFLAMLNAVNFLDNMNGLCGGLGCVASCHLAVAASGQGDGVTGAGACALAGAAVGFLPYNFPRAKVFLGDAGSHLVGGLVAILAMRTCASASAGQGGLVLGALGVLLVPAVDLVQVVIRRWRKGRPVYVGDTEHVSHLLVRAGLSRVWAVVLLWLVSALAGSLAWWRF